MSAIAARYLPQLALVDAFKKDWSNNPTAPLPLSQFSSDIPAKRWVRIVIPLTRFQPTAIGGFDPQRVSTLVLSQGAAVDGKSMSWSSTIFGSSLTLARPPCRPHRLA